MQKHEKESVIQMPIFIIRDYRENAGGVIVLTSYTQFKIANVSHKSKKLPADVVDVDYTVNNMVVDMLDNALDE